MESPGTHFVVCVSCLLQHGTPKPVCDAVKAVSDARLFAPASGGGHTSWHGRLLFAAKLVAAEKELVANLARAVGLLLQQPEKGGAWLVKHITGKWEARHRHSPTIDPPCSHALANALGVYHLI